MKLTDVTFDELRDVLAEIGFRETQEKTRKRFEHPLGPVLLYRLYKDKEKISARDMLVTRGQLDDQGLIDAAEFDRRTQKTPA